MRLQDLYEQYHEKVQFLNIYIREAHPVDGWWFGKGPMAWVMKRYSPRAATDVYDPQSMDERRSVAGRCQETLQYGIPTRLYLIGLNGRVLYAAGKGPLGFKPAELEEALKSIVALNG